jgi:MFS family permease
MSGRLTARGLPFYYGWVVFAVTFLIYMFMYGLRYSVGVFFTPIKQDFDWSTAVTASAVTIFFWVYAASAPLVGSLAEKIGVRKTVLFGGLLLGGGGFLVSFIQKLWHLYLFWGIIAAVGAAALYIVPTMALSRFFLRKRGRAVGWSSVGVSAGQAIFVPVIAVLIQEHGWRLAVRWFSLVVVTVTSALGYLFIREDPGSMGLSVDGEKYEEEELDRVAISSPRLNWEPRKAMKTSLFRLLALSYFFAVGGIISILTFAVPRMIDIGIVPVKAGGAFGIIGAMSAAGSFLFGIFSDRLGRRATISVTTAGIALSFFMALALPPNLILLYAWAILYGLTYGGCPEQYAAIVADYFGNRYSTTIFGFITLAGGLGGGLFPLIGGWLVDLSGAYNWTLLFLASRMCIATLLILFTNPPKRR